MPTCRTPWEFSTARWGVSMTPSMRCRLRFSGIRISPTPNSIWNWRRARSAPARVLARRRRRAIRKRFAMSQDTAANINLSVTGSAMPEARLWAAGLTIYALTLLAYLPVLNKGSFIWDDDSYIVNNPALKSPDGLKQIWFGILPDPLLYSVRVVPQYYPMTVTSFWLEYRMWEANPRGYHIVNVLLHATSAVLLWIILRKLAVPGAWVIAAIFALHPVQVESVAWITERKNVLSGAFYLASLLVYMRFCGLDPIGARFSSRS